MIEITKSPDTKQWSEFVFNHPHGNIFQTPEMAEVYRRTKNYEPVTLAAISDTGEMVAVLQAVVIKELSGVLGSFSARAIIQGGSLFIENENGIDALKVLMGHYDKIVQKKALYSQIRTMWDTSNVSYILNSRGYEYEERLNFLNNLISTEEELWKKLSRERRWGVNKAVKNGVIVEEIRDKGLIKVVYELLRETYMHAKLPLADITFFEAIFDVFSPKNRVVIFSTKYGDLYIGVIFLLTYKEAIYGFYLGASKDYLNLRPNDFLLWHVIKWGAEKGYHTFDLGGAGKPDEEYGVREFKKQFGGKLVNLGRYTKVHSHIKMKIAKKGFGLYRKMFI